ncbi:cysteine desulfurase [Bacillus sp. HMF5848]|uniref:cysteine desulfurase family protein n=1 Tax=Bacillus sp. HMF5848 TaxID=2495421 RepID=UPI000F7914A9|nr:cysteine desulfurase family protein [Bacillus sp. HMF5848]RSK27972.1 cysteine desulfurase [Bacillus sp. HMF5848]
MEHVYLDHAATSPMHPEVAEAMLPYMTEIFGNPSSIHSFGRQARHALDVARRTLANSISARESEIIFTSGGTEADNLAILGVAAANSHKGKHIITTEIEHHAVLHVCERLEKQGYEVSYLPVNEYGQVTVEQVQQALRDDTILVTIMYGNNEVGTIQPISKIGELLRDHQAYFHTDAVQAYGTLSIDVNSLYIDLLSVSGHKINGPKGFGFLYVKQGTLLEPIFYGGEQEKKRRAGTENIASAVGMAKAVELSQQTMQERTGFYQACKKKLLATFDAAGIAYEINGSHNESLPHILNVAFPKTRVEAMLVNLDLAGIAVSSGSACTAGSIEPSHVLVAMFGKNSERILSSIRFSFGLHNSLDEIERAANEVVSVVRRLVTV